MNERVQNINQRSYLKLLEIIQIDAKKVTLAN